MTILKKLALAAAIAAFAGTGAHAAGVEEDTTFKLKNLTEGTGGISTGTHPISNLGFDIDGHAVQPRLAGDTFVDDFFLEIQDDQYVSFYTNVMFGPKPTLTFTLTSIGLYDLLGGVYSPLDVINSKTSLYEDGFKLHSGTYYLEITGDIVSNGGSYSGVLTTTPVPEPTGWALMLAGLGAMGVLARRRKTQA